jgi:hypothetical protein
MFAENGRLASWLFATVCIFLLRIAPAYTGAMNSRLDLLLILGIALCYGLGHLFAAERFAMAAGLLLLIFMARMLRNSITWLLGGR